MRSELQIHHQLALQSSLAARNRHDARHPLRAELELARDAEEAEREAKKLAEEAEEAGRAYAKALRKAAEEVQ
jgi:hypothetical protein